MGDLRIESRFPRPRGGDSRLELAELAVVAYSRSRQ
jgi:hypothetical protein